MLVGTWGHLVLWNPVPVVGSFGLLHGCGFVTRAIYFLAELEAYGVTTDHDSEVI